MRLAIADPPYPPFVGSGGRKNRASRRYGDGQRSRKDARMVADFHPEAHRWDDPDEWTWWVLDALTCQPTDEVVDLFGGSGGVADAIASYRA